MIPYEIRNNLQTGIVALLFIAGGIRILAGGRKEGDARGRSFGRMRKWRVGPFPWEF